MPFKHKQAQSHRKILKIVLLYILLGAAWILISDKVVEFFIPDPKTRVHISIYKGLAYVALTSLSLYVLIVRFWRQTREVSKAQLRTLGLLETIADKSNEAIYAKDCDGRYIFFNRAASVLVGRPVDEVLGKDDRSIFPLDQAAVLKAYEDAVMTEARTETRQEVVDTVLGERTFLATKGPLYDHHGQLFGIFGISRDITDSVAAQAQMLRLNRALRLLGEGNLALLRVRSEQELLDEICGHVIAVGGYKMVWIGYPEQGGDKRIVPMAVSGAETGYLSNIQVSWDETKDIGRGPSGEAVRTGKPQINHDVLVNPAMAPWRKMALEYGYNSSVALPLICEGNTLGVLTIYAAEAFAFSESEMGVLEELAANLAFGIHSLREREERRAAELTSKTKSSLLANMSHEIRTPLSAITGLGHLLARSDLAPRQREMVDQVNVAAEHLSNVINDILDLSKIDAGKFSLQERDVDIEQLLSETVRMVEEGPKAKGVALRVIPASSPFPPLLGDPLRLRQGVLNYLSNAIKFTDKGNITVEAALLEQHDDEVLLRIEVKDTGIGIAAEALPRLFGAFEQADNSISSNFQGTGLGLAITRALARLMGGDAGVQSSPGQGSLFWFTARLRKGKRATSAHDASNRVPAERELATRFAGRQILVVDDNAVNREIALAMLKDFAAQQVDLAKDGQEAGIKAAAMAYLLIVMDLQVPVMDGVEATREIRHLPSGRAVPIIAVTADVQPEDRKRCLDAGMDDFLSKPFEPDVFFTVIRKWLSGEAKHSADQA